MANLTPVNNDPFAPSPNLTPVDHDPFAVQQPNKGGIGDLADTARVTGNTFGIYDRLAATSKVGFPASSSGEYFGPGDTSEADRAALLKAEQAKTEAASGRIGPIASAIANAAGYAPFMGVGIAGGLGGGIIGNAAEGAVGQGLAAAGHGNSVLAGAGTGAITGAVLTPVAGIANAIGRSLGTPIGRALGIIDTPEKAIAKAAAKEAQAWDLTKQVTFNPSDVNAAFIKGFQSLEEDQKRNLSPSMNATLNQHFQANQTVPSVTASNINGFGRDLQGSVKSNADSVLMGRIRSHLDDVLEKSKPLSGNNLGNPLDLVNSAKAASQQSTMAKGLSDASTALKNQYQNPGPWAGKQSGYYQPGSPEYNVLSDIVRRSGGMGNLPSGYGMAHVGGDLAELGFSLADMPASGLAVGAGVQLAKPILSGAMKTLNKQALLRKLNAAYPTLSGQQVNANPHLGDMIKSLVQGKVAGSGY